MLRSYLNDKIQLLEISFIYSIERIVLLLNGKWTGSYKAVFYSLWAHKVLYTTRLIHPFTPSHTSTFSYAFSFSFQCDSFWRCSWFWCLIAHDSHVCFSYVFTKCQLNLFIYSCCFYYSFYYPLGQVSLQRKIRKRL